MFDCNLHAYKEKQINNPYVIKIIDKYIILEIFTIFLDNKRGIIPRQWGIIPQKQLYKSL